MNKLFYFFISLFLFYSCGNEVKESENDISQEEVKIVIPPKPERTKLIANIDYLRLRSEAGTDSETVAMLERGQVMHDLGEISDFTTAVELRGVKYNEPWLKVETADGQKGWVYGGGVYFDLNNSSKAMDLLMKKRLMSFYGKDISEDVFAYRKAFTMARTDKDMARVIEEGSSLAKEMNEKNEKILPMANPENAKDVPDLRWLQQSLPGYHLGSAAEGTIYWFYRNLKQFSEKASKTRGKADDDFINLNIQLFPKDSIEYFYPIYFMQTWDYGGHSLLGEGKHLEILTTANEVMAKHPSTFDAEINEIKDNLIQDLTASPQGYWYGKTRILSEIDKIMKAELGILTEKDKIAIGEQRKRFTDPAASGIKVGLRSGEQ
jgi:hypothetical protein